MRIGKFKLNHYINYIVIGILTVVLSVITMTGGRLDSSLLFLLEKIAISIILAVSLSLVVGFLGELSLGHAGFMCVGAYLGGSISEVLVKALELALNGGYDMVSGETQILVCTTIIETGLDIPNANTMIIENADKMQESVRNALLKILEEPPADCNFVLTTSNRGAVMPTILSRVRTYNFYHRTVSQQLEVVKRVFHDDDISFSNISEYLTDRDIQFPDCILIQIKTM